LPGSTIAAPCGNRVPPPGSPRSTSARAWLTALAIAGISATGCQVDVGGQTLPSAYYLEDDIQYFPAGPEFKLSREAAAQKAYRKEMQEREAAGPYRP